MLGVAWWLRYWNDPAQKLDADNFAMDSHRSQLVATAVAASLSTAGLLCAWNSYSKAQRRRELERDVRRAIANRHDNEDDRPDSPDIQLQAFEGEAILTKIGSDIGYSEELIREQLARNYAFFGEEGMANIRGKSVVVVGCGGVGSWAAIMLVRS